MAQNDAHSNRPGQRAAGQTHGDRRVLDEEDGEEYVCRDGGAGAKRHPPVLGCGMAGRLRERMPGGGKRERTGWGEGGHGCA